MGWASHGHTSSKRHSPEYVSWRGMINRCRNRRDPSYRNYGARGISVCKRWLRFEAFLADMGPRPAGTWLERIDNGRGYRPNNCRWATPSEQLRNTRRNRRLSFCGRTLTVTNWAAEIGLTREGLAYRIRSGWPLDQALTVPAGVRCGKRRSSW